MHLFYVSFNLLSHREGENLYIWIKRRIYIYVSYANTLGKSLFTPDISAETPLDSTLGYWEKNCQKISCKNLSKKVVYLTTQRHLFPPYLSLIKTLPFKMAKWISYHFNQLLHGFSNPIFPACLLFSGWKIHIRCFAIFWVTSGQWNVNIPWQKSLCNVIFIDNDKIIIK